MTHAKRRVLIYILAILTTLCLTVTLLKGESNVSKAKDPVSVTSVEIDGITSDMIPQIGRSIKKLSKYDFAGYVRVSANDGIELSNVMWLSYNLNSQDVGDTFLSGYTYGVRITFGMTSADYTNDLEMTSSYTIKGIDSSLYTAKPFANNGMIYGVDYMFDTLGNEEVAMVDESKLTIPEGYVSDGVNSGYIYLKGGKYPYVFDEINTPDWLTSSGDYSRGVQLNLLFTGNRPTTTEGAQEFSFRVTDANGDGKVFRGTIGATVENPNMIKEINVDYTIPSVGEARPTRAQLHETIILPDGISWNVNTDGSGVDDYGGSASWSGETNFTTFEKYKTYTLKLYLKAEGDKVFAGEVLLKGTLTSGGKTYTASFGSHSSKFVVFSVKVTDFGVDSDKIRIDTDSLPHGKRGVPYEAKIKGGCGELERFRENGNSTGLTFSNDGTLSGIPSKAGEFTLGVYYYFNDVMRDSKSYKIIIEDYTKVDVPVAKTGLKYNGEAQVGVEESACYTLTNNKATSVGEHTAVAKLKAGYCWSDNTTEDKNVIWKIGKGQIASPSGLVGVKTSIEGASDGRITGVNGTMEYKAEGATAYVRCTGSVINNLVAGKYYVRYKETDNFEASDDTVVTVPDGDKITHTVTVTGGTGGGTYEVGATVTVRANSAESGYVFTGWTITGVSVDNSSQTEISFVMPDCNVTVIANYRAIEYGVVVDGGTADVARAVKGTVVTITANPANTGERFDKWEIVSGAVTLADVTSGNTSFVMQTSDVTVRAVFKKVVYNVVVNGGTALKGNSIVTHATYGEEITVRCNDLAIGVAFDKWTAVGVSLSDDRSSQTTFTMPANDVTIVANTKTVASHAVSVDGGLGGGIYYVGQTVTVTAGFAPEGKTFDKWEIVSGDVTLEDANNATTTFVMIDGEVTIKATYKDIAPSGDGDASAEKNGGLNGGAIAGIVIGSVVVVGAGGFAIFWFVVRKKSFADLVVAIKSLIEKIKSAFKKK